MTTINAKDIQIRQEIIMTDLPAFSHLVRANSVHTTTESRKWLKSLVSSQRLLSGHSLEAGGKQLIKTSRTCIRNHPSYRSSLKELFLETNNILYNG